MEAANDNRYVRVIGGGNVGANLNMLTHLYDAIVEARTPLGGNPLSNSGTIYVIGEAQPTYVKIGKASDPVSRLKALQTGNPHRLYLHRVFQFAKMADASRIERWAHQDAGRRFNQALGEWFECQPTDAHEVIEKIAEGEKIRCTVMTPVTEPQWARVHRAGAEHLEMIERMRAQYD